MNTAAAMDVQLQAYISNGTALPLLFCVPILIKDNFDALDGKHCLPCDIRFNTLSCISTPELCL